MTKVSQTVVLGWVRLPAAKTGYEQLPCKNDFMLLYSLVITSTSNYTECNTSTSSLLPIQNNRHSARSLNALQYLI